MTLSIHSKLKRLRDWSLAMDIKYFTDSLLDISLLIHAGITDNYVNNKGLTCRRSMMMFHF